ncbi:MAG: MmcQ/YjbR family DNA-binding protein [Pyrinomonadaceae bacterium]
MKRITKERELELGEKHVERVRQICLALPETWEKISHGEPAFFVLKRVFAMCSTNHHNDGHFAVVIPAAIGIQAALIETSPKKFYRPPYVGGAGWVGIELPRVKDKELAMHLQEAWRLIAPEKLHAALEQALLVTSKGSKKMTLLNR